MIPEEAIIELRDASDNEVRYGDTEHHYNEVMKRIEALDIAIKALEQQPKTGHWIEKEDCNLDIYYDCSECGESFCLIDGTPTDNLYNYCPNCGAKMVETRMAESEEQGMTNEERKVVKEQMIKYGFKAPDMTVTEFVEDCLPSVAPTRPTGRWERRFVDYKKCSICGEIVKYYHDYKYCPNCGCEMTEKMRESEEEE